MQGNLRQTDIYTILQVIESGQKTGTLLVNSDRCDYRQSQMWLIFFGVAYLRDKLAFETIEKSFQIW